MRSIVRTVAVVGGGTVGAGIALDFALGGKEVVVFNRTTASGEGARDRMTRAGALLVEFGLADAEDVAAAMRRLSTTTDIAAAVAKADYVVEAVAEDLAVKQAVLKEIEQHVDPGVVIASTSTAIKVTDLAAACQEPERVVGARYTLPAQLIPVVDVTAGDATTHQAVEITHSVLTDVGKTPVVLGRDAPGGIGPRLLSAMMSEAFRLVDEGVADPVTIDKVVTGGIGRRLGAVGIFDRMDVAGLDTVASVFERRCNPVPAALAEKIEVGALGRKAGRGFYPWSPADVAAFDRREALHLAGHVLRDRQTGDAGTQAGLVRLEPGVLDEFLDAARAEYLAATPQDPPRCFAVLIGTVTDEVILVAGARFARTSREADDNIATVWNEAIVPCFGAAYANRRRGFWVHPRDLLEINRAAGAEGLDVLGSVHLHPDWHRTGPPGERGMRISERPTRMDRFMIASTGWPLNMICYIERGPHGLGHTLAAWAPPSAADPAGPCVRLTIQHAIA